MGLTPPYFGTHGFFGGPCGWSATMFQKPIDMALTLTSGHSRSFGDIDMITFCILVGLFSCFFLTSNMLLSIFGSPRNLKKLSCQYPAGTNAQICQQNSPNPVVGSNHCLWYQISPREFGMKCPVINGFCIVISWSLRSMYLGLDMPQRQCSFRGTCGWIPLRLDCFAWTN